MKQSLANCLGYFYLRLKNIYDLYAKLPMTETVSQFSFTYIQIGQWK